ncbi:MAG: SDR family NAD(P)-dependent oxidoreductase [Hyphomonadaceae bacterium]|nr:SDR family NAD(P)-dependent oxidoreductase [Hyphomonadaceae bacterium]
MASALAATLQPKGWRVTGTYRTAAPSGVEAVAFDGRASPALHAALAQADAVLSSIPPDDAGDPALRALGAHLGRPGVWTGYLSTTGVYGDRGGAWVDEDTPIAPLSVQAQRRAAAEDGWRSIGAHVFRLPGIYGPGRSALDRLRAGEARRVVKPGLVHSRIHVDDIATALAASIAHGGPAQTWNVTDDAPSPPQDVIVYAAQLLDMPPPPETPYDPAAMAPQARRFFEESRRVSNARLKAALGWRPAYPSYREGLAAILAQETP